MIFYPESAVERTMKIQEVILRAMAKKITWWQAAEIIGISDRQMRRWYQRYQEFTSDPSRSLRSRRSSRPETTSSRPSGSQSIQNGRPKGTRATTSLLPSRSTATISRAPQSENQRRFSCHRGDSPIATPVIRICVLGADDGFGGIAIPLDPSNGGALCHSRRPGKAPVGSLAKFGRLPFPNLAGALDSVESGWLRIARSPSGLQPGADGG